MTEDDQTTGQDTAAGDSGALSDRLAAASAEACVRFAATNAEQINTLMRASDTLHDLAYRKILERPDELMAFEAPEVRQPVTDNASVLALERLSEGDTDQARELINGMSFEDLVTTHSMATQISSAAERIQQEPGQQANDHTQPKPSID